VEHREHTVSASKDLHNGITTWRITALRQQHGEQGGSGCPTALGLSEWRASCHREIAEEELPRKRSGCPSPIVVDGEAAAEKTLQSDATSASR
jgi:hypothetical protein